MYAWNKCAGFPPLPEGEVHLWLVSLQPSPGMMEFWRAQLSAAELERLGRLRDGRMRRQRIIGWGSRRELLGRYLQCDGRSLAFAAGLNGKPALAAPPSGQRIEFNVSYAAEWVLLGFALNRRLGVDIECWTETDIETLAQVHLTENELAQWRALQTEAERREAFYNAWTRKEAYLKARGDGLLPPLTGIEVSLLPAADPVLIRDAGDAGAADRWQMAAFRIDGSTSASLVIEKPVSHIHTARHGD